MTDEQVPEAYLDPFRVEYHGYDAKTNVDARRSNLAYELARTAIAQVMHNIITPPPLFHRAAEVRQPDPLVHDTRTIPTIRVNYPSRRSQPKRAPEYFLLDTQTIVGVSRLQKRGRVVEAAVDGLLHELERSGVANLQPGSAHLFRGGLVLTSRGRMIDEGAKDRTVSDVPGRADSLINVVAPLAHGLLAKISGGKLLPAIYLTQPNYRLVHGTYIAVGDVLRRPS